MSKPMSAESSGILNAGSFNYLLFNTGTLLPIIYDWHLGIFCKTCLIFAYFPTSEIVPELN
jgi:hypothetical protein